MKYKYIIVFFVPFILAGCGTDLSTLDVYGKDLPPGEMATGDSKGNIVEPSQSFSEPFKTPMRLSPGN